MLITKIRLINFGMIKDEEILLGPGIHVFKGASWNGKSTILKGIYINLFDYYVGKKYEDYVRWGEDSFESVVYFTHEGLECESSLGFEIGSGSSRSLQIGTGVENNFTGSDAKAKLQELFPKELTMAAMVSEQNRVDLISTKPAERREYLRKIFEVSFPEEILSAETVISEYESQLSDLEKKFFSLDTKVYQYKDVPEETVSEEEFFLAVADKKDLESQKLLIEKEIEEYETLSSSINNSQIKVQKAVDNNTTKALEADRKSKELEAFNDNSIEERANLVDEHGLSTGVYLALASDDVEISFLQQDHDSLTPLRISAYDSNLIEDLRVQKTQSQMNIKSFEKELDLLKEGICPTCGQSLHDPEKENNTRASLAEAGLRLSVIEDQIQKENSAIFEHAKKIKKNDEVIERKRSLQNQIQERQSQLSVKGAVAKADMEAAAKALEVFDSNLEHRRVLLAELAENAMAQSKEASENLEESRAVLKALTDKLPSEAPELPEDLEESLKQCLTQVETYNDWLVVAREVKIHNDGLDAQKILDETSKKTLSDDINKLQVEISHEKKSLLILKNDFPAYILTAKTEMLAKKMNVFLGQTEGAEHKIGIVLGSRNALNVVYGPHESEVAIASGYEQQVFSMSWKVALSETIDNRCLILDEADSNADSNSSIKFFEYLFGLVGTQYEQILVISHKADVMDKLQGSYTINEYNLEKGVIV